MGNLIVYWQRVVDGNAIPISLMGMAIVFLALMFISAFIGCLPFILRLLGLVSDEEESVVTAAKANVPDEQIVAAIGAVLRYRAEGQK